MRVKYKRWSPKEVFIRLNEIEQSVKNKARVNKIEEREGVGRRRFKNIDILEEVSKELYNYFCQAPARSRLNNATENKIKKKQEVLNE